ncbi:MAG TPA: CopG family transcriptional regulator [Acidimicrobiales bacterium]|jgi:hypothetical protein|nr:CopG family transcriptional regulator [Acidimicrobiales bacterium]
MRTTVAIDDRLLKAAKRTARQRGVTLGTVIEDALRRDLTERAAVQPGPAVPVFRGGTGLRPGVDAGSTRTLLEALDDEVPPDRLR